MLWTRVLLVLPLLVGYTDISVADVLLIDSIQKQSEKGLATPTLGQLKAQVRQQFGEPKQIVAAVGTPPIGRWIYDEFTVYFESNYVIHSVVHRTTKP